MPLTSNIRRLAKGMASSLSASRRILMANIDGGNRVVRLPADRLAVGKVIDCEAVVEHYGSIEVFALIGMAVANRQQLQPVDVQIVEFSLYGIRYYSHTVEIHGVKQGSIFLLIGRRFGIDGLAQRRRTPVNKIMLSTADGIRRMAHRRCHNTGQNTRC